MPSNLRPTSTTHMHRKLIIVVYLRVAPSGNYRWKLMKCRVICV